MKKKSIKSDLERIDALSEEQIDYSDIPALGEEFLTKTATVWAPPKRHVSVRIDEDVLEWLKSMGKGYQTRMNLILRATMEQQLHKKP